MSVLFIPSPWQKWTKFHFLAIITSSDKLFFFFFFLVKAIPAKITELPRLDNVCYSRGSRDPVVTVLEHLVHRTKASTLIMAVMLFLRKLKDHICIPAAALSGISASVRIAWSLSKVQCLSF